MATPNVTIDIADFLTGQLPASKGGYPVTLVPVPDIAPRWRNAFTNSSGAATLSAVVPGTYVLRIGGLGIPDRTVTVPDESGPLAASDLTVGGTTSAAVPTQSNPLLAGSNITLTQKASGLEIAASGGGGEGTASGDVAFTSTLGALSVESTAPGSGSTIAFTFSTATLQNGDKIAEIYNGATLKFSLFDWGALYSHGGGFYAEEEGEETNFASVESGSIALNVGGFPVAALNTNGVLVPTNPPENASSTGTAGTITWDEDFVYVCTASNTWKRAALSTWP